MYLTKTNICCTHTGSNLRRRLVQSPLTIKNISTVPGVKAMHGTTMNMHLMVFFEHMENVAIVDCDLGRVASIRLLAVTGRSLADPRAFGVI